MKKLIPLVALPAVFFMMPSCKEDTRDYTLINAKLNDSISTILPACQSFRSNIPDDRSSILVVDGDLSFYDAPADVKAKKAEELGKMILRFFGKDNHLESGKLIVTKDTRNKVDDPKDGISIPIPIAELKKAGY